MKTILAAALAFGLTAAAEPPQNTTAPSGASAGGLAGLLGGALPNVGAASAGNAAGLLGYCVKNNVLGGAGAASVLGKLTGKPGITEAPGYAEGQAGTLQTGRSALPLDAVKGKLRTKLCGLVLKRAGAFL